MPRSDSHREHPDSKPGVLLLNYEAKEQADSDSHRGLPGWSRTGWAADPIDLS